MARRGTSNKFYAEELGPWGAESREQSIKKFWAFVDKTAGPDACWLWRSYTNEKGYGLMSFAGRSNVRAHRVSYELAHGVTLEPRQFLMHSCDNPPCVNPAHLSLCNNQDNIADIYAKGKHPNGMHPDRVREIRAALDAVEPGGGEIERIAKQFGIHSSVASAIRNRTKYWYIK